VQELLVLDRYDRTGPPPPAQPTPPAPVGYTAHGTLRYVSRSPSRPPEPKRSRVPGIESGALLLMVNFVLIGIAAVVFTFVYFNRSRHRAAPEMTAAPPPPATVAVVAPSLTEDAPTIVPAPPTAARITASAPTKGRGKSVKGAKGE